MNYGYIYKITNNINGKIYIGQKKCKKANMTKDEMLNDGYMGSGVHIKRAEEKYGIENFTKEICAVCEDKDELDETETLFISLAKIGYGEDCYNIAAGGGAGNPYEYKTEEEKAAICAKQSESVKAMWANMTEEEKTAAVEKWKETMATKSEAEMKAYRTKQSEAAKKRYEDPEERKKRSKVSKKIWANYTEEKLADISKNCSEGQKEKYKDPEEHKKISEAHSAFINIYGINKDTGEKTEVFATLYEAKAFIFEKGYKTATALSATLSGKRKSAYGYYWFGEKNNK